MKTMSRLPANRFQTQTNNKTLYKRSCGEVPEILAQISTTAAGTGMTALFPVICSLASRRTQGGAFLECASSTGKTFFMSDFVVLAIKEPGSAAPAE
ncbi:unnamed protein product [Eruca vesicaria subsp. sativa]|uniref:Uncharacterized protein n=1 Tax=Eruca vesicaria subsp. sativa TaxID=29727 RepID=A0ABC8KVB1_ERUVS|nr:unnamed protein product [Eruca vesicaria subsp. sativa]